jgi:hypothetical protein
LWQRCVQSAPKAAAAAAWAWLMLPEVVCNSTHLVSKTYQSLAAAAGLQPQGPYLGTNNATVAQEFCHAMADNNMASKWSLLLYEAQAQTSACHTPPLPVLARSWPRCQGTLGSCSQHC